MLVKLDKNIYEATYTKNRMQSAEKNTKCMVFQNERKI